MKELEIKYQSRKTIMKREKLISIIKMWKTCLDWIVYNLQHWGFTPDDAVNLTSEKHDPNAQMNHLQKEENKKTL